MDYLHNLLKELDSFHSPTVIYASSGSVYGNEEMDFTERIDGLIPTNAYAFTKWSLDSNMHRRPGAYGLRFFNVYGPREQAKGDMASLVHKGLAKEAPLYRDGQWKLFKSHRPDVRHGEQARDFVHVDDVCNVIWHFATTDQARGIYNVGSGTARTFNDLVTAVDPTLPIEYVDMPEVLRPQYQYHTKADLTKLRAAGYTEPFMTLEQGVEKTREWLKVNS